VILVDANLLLYAYDAASPFHARAKEIWQDCLSSEESLGIPWATIQAFLRIVTSPRVFESPLTMPEAAQIVDEWLGRPMVVLAEPTPTHWKVFRDLLLSTHCGANLVPDAHLAALAIEHGATLYSTDHDFSRFGQLRWVNPFTPPDRKKG
jgi:hypothetical protein